MPEHPLDDWPRIISAGGERPPEGYQEINTITRGPHFHASMVCGLCGVNIPKRVCRIRSCPLVAAATDRGMCINCLRSARLAMEQLDRGGGPDGYVEPPDELGY